MLKIVESVWAVGALSQSLLGELTAPPRALQLAAPPQNLRPRFSALRASFGNLPNSLHLRSILRGLDKTLVGSKLRQAVY